MPAHETWPRTIAEAIGVMMAKANGGEPDDAPAVNELPPGEIMTGEGCYFTIDTPGGYMRVSVQAVPE